MPVMDVAIMIEGQNGLNWPRWQRIAQAVEELGFNGLFRSDHFTNAEPPDLDSLELWTSLTWLASHTERIIFGPLVSPVSFRHPTQTARMAAAVDDLSNGRLILGLGAGWNAREHQLFGHDLLETTERFLRFEEGLEVITRLLHSDKPVEFDGRYYQLRGAVLLPRPKRPGGPPILIGGNGVKLTLPLVARFGDEWNAVSLTPEAFKEKNASLDRLLASQGRASETVRRSMMTGCVFGKSSKEVEEKVARRTQGKRGVAELLERGLIVGTASEVIEQLLRLAKAGVQQIMLQWLDLDDIAGLEGLARDVLPQIK